MGRVHFIGGEKGGVGKSMTARLLAQYLIDAEMPFTGFDGDKSHGTFSRFYAEFAAPLVVDDYASLDAILETAEANPAQDIVVDLAAQTSGSLDQWIRDSDVFGLFQELGFQTYLWHVMDDGLDSVNLLAKTLTAYGDEPLQLLVVENLGRGNGFKLFENSETYRQAQQSGACFFKLPKLETKLCQKIDFNNHSFWAAANDRQLMGFAERRRVSVWLKNCYAQLDTLLPKQTLAQVPVVETIVSGGPAVDNSVDSPVVDNGGFENQYQ